MRLSLLWSVCLVLASMLFLMGCNNSQSSTPATTQPPLSPVAQAPITSTTASSTTNPQGKIAACSLLTAEEIRTVQGETFTETKASRSVENGLAISQCFFNLPTFANSVSLAVTQKGEGAAARDPRDFWEQTFSQGAERDKRDKSREEEEKSSAAQKIEGVGDEAFWTGSRVGGALYVLKRDSFIRVSVGGAGDQQVKMEKSKSLARLALKRLS